MDIPAGFMPELPSDEKAIADLEDGFHSCIESVGRYTLPQQHLDSFPLTRGQGRFLHDCAHDPLLRLLPVALDLRDEFAAALAADLTAAAARSDVVTASARLALLGGEACVVPSARSRLDG